MDTILIKSKILSFQIGLILISVVVLAPQTKFICWTSPSDYIFIFLFKRAIFPPITEKTIMFLFPKINSHPFSSSFLSSFGCIKYSHSNLVFGHFSLKTNSKLSGFIQNGSPSHFTITFISSICFTSKNTFAL